MVKLRRTSEKLPGELAIFFGEENFSSEIDNSNPEFFDRSRELTAQHGRLFR